MREGERAKVRSGFWVQCANHCPVTGPMGVSGGESWEMKVAKAREQIHNSWNYVGRGVMNTFLSFDNEKQILLVRFEGVVTDDVLLERYAEVRRYFAEHGSCGNISDFTHVSAFQVTSNAIRFLATNAPLVPETFVRVLVAPQDEVYGLSRMFAMMGSEMGNRVDIVRDIHEAFRLAGVDGTGFRPVE